MTKTLIKGGRGLWAWLRDRPGGRMQSSTYQHFLSGQVLPEVRKWYSWWLNIHCLNFIMTMIAGSFPCGSLMAVSVRCVVWWILIEFSLYITQDFTTNHAYMISIVLNFTFLSEKLSKLPRGQVTQIQTELWPDLSAPEGPRWTCFSS